MSLFDSLPSFPTPLPEDELKLLAKLPEYYPDECVLQIWGDEQSACRRLEKRGLVKVHRWKEDPCDHQPSMYAGKLPSTALTAVLVEKA